MQIDKHLRKTDFFDTLSQLRCPAPITQKSLSGPIILLIKKTPTKHPLCPVQTFLGNVLQKCDAYQPKKAPSLAVLSCAGSLTRFLTTYIISFLPIYLIHTAEAPALSANLNNKVIYVDFNTSLNSGEETLLNVLYLNYAENRQTDTETITHLFDKLYANIHFLNLQSTDIIIDLVCSLCTEHERLAFYAAFKAGCQFAAEIQ